MKRDGGWLEGWLHLVGRLVPGPERDRWLEEWRSDLEAARTRGISWSRRLVWAVGVSVAAIRFRREELTMEGWGREVRYALRGLVRKPGFAAVAVLTLGLGIGANTAIFSVVNGVLLRPLPYPAADRLVMVTSAFPTMGFFDFWISAPEYLELQERSRSFSSLGAYRQTQASIGGGDQPERVTSAIASASLLEALGVSPFMGRLYTADEDLPGGDPVVLLSHPLWVRTFGGDPGVIGRSVEVNGVSRTVVGVMPPGFDLEDQGIDAWIPLGLDPADRTQRASHYLFLVGRLAPGVSFEAASAELHDLVARWADENPDTHVPTLERHPLEMISLQEDVVGDVRRALLLLLGAVGLVLLIACANVANLLLARAEDRQKEVAVRVAMGAGRGRLVRQFLMEGLALSVLGAALGLGLAWLSLEALRALSPGDIPRIGEISLDGWVLFFTSGIAVLTGVVFGLAPARHLTPRTVGGTIRDGGLRTTAGLGHARLRSLLVVSEVALALILAVGAGLLTRSFQALTRVEPGFDSRGVLTFQLYLPSTGYPDPTDVVAFQEELESSLGALPGVEGAAVMSGLPPLRDLNANDTEFEGFVRTEDGPPQNVDFYQWVDASYLETMEIPVVRGRGFLPSDGPDAVPVVLVNETLANLFYPGEEALGRRLRPCCGDDLPWFQIVGVVGDVKQAGLDQPVGTELYIHLPQAAGLMYAGNMPRSLNVVLRTAGSPASLAPAAREEVWRLDPTLPLAGVMSMEDVLAGARARPRFLTLLLLVFAGLALVLSAVGTYGVMSYSVAQRARELGIRIALGAERGAVLGLVLKQGLLVTAVGLILGLGGALALSGVIRSLLFQVAPRDLTTFLTVPLLLGAVATLALLVPALRATRVDPNQVLREE